MYGGEVPPEARHFADSVAASGGSPLLVAVHDWDGARVLGLIHLRDVVKDHIRERFDELRRMDIRTVMVTGDNPLTARAIAEEAGVDDYLADVGVAMNTGISAAKEARNMVDLDSNPTKLVELVEIGKQLLITRDWST